MADYWRKILEKLEKMLDSSDFRVWIEPLTAEIAGHSLVLSMPGFCICKKDLCCCQKIRKSLFSGRRARPAAHRRTGASPPGSPEQASDRLRVGFGTETRPFFL